MITSIPEDQIIGLLSHQLRNTFLLSDDERRLLEEAWPEVKGKLEYCFSRTPNKYYSHLGEIYFNPYQSAQYTIFLYFMSRSIWVRTGNSILSDKIYYLNKTLNGCDLFYQVDLPDFFKLDHPVGSVMGRANYGEGFSFGQCCTVGNNRGIYPVLGKNVRMCAFSSIIGNCKVGDNVIIGSNSGIKDINIPSDMMVFGHTPNNVIKPIKS